MFLISTNLLHDSIGKDCVYFNRADYMSVGQDMLQTWTCGHILSHNIIHSYYFGNLVCPHVVQDRLQTKSTSIHMIMLGEPYGDQGDQRGCPKREGGPKLIRFESPRWRPKSSSSPSRVLDQSIIKLVTRARPGSVFDDPRMDGKII